METTEITVKIAPDLNDIKVVGNVLECEFNNMEFRLVLAIDPRYTKFEIILGLKTYLQAAIGFSSKTWQIVDYLKRHIKIKHTLHINIKN